MPFTVNNDDALLGMEEGDAGQNYTIPFSPLSSVGLYDSPSQPKPAEEPDYPPFPLPDGNPVLAAAKAYLTALMTGDTANPRLLAHAQRVMRVMRAMAHIFTPPEGTNDNLREIADSRLQPPYPVETFNSRLIREFAPVLAQYMATQGEQAKTARADMELRAMELALDARKEGHADIAERAEAIAKGEGEDAHEQHNHGLDPDRCPDPDCDCRSSPSDPQAQEPAPTPTSIPTPAPEPA